MRRCRVRSWKSLLFVSCILACVVIWNTWSIALRACQFCGTALPFALYQQATYNSLAVANGPPLTASNNGSSVSTHGGLDTNRTQTFQQGQVPSDFLMRSSNPDIIARGEFQRLQVQKFCQKYGPTDLERVFRMDRSVLQEFMRHLIFSDEKKLIYCFIPKHGCTNLKRLMLYTTGDIPLNTLEWLWVEDSIYLEPALSRSSLLNANLTDQQRKQRISYYKKFMVVRHPLERLVSAFRDKLEPPVSYKSQFLFPHRLKADIVKARRHLDYLRWRREKGSFNLTITFSEFIDYFVEKSPDELNEHFRLPLAICHPCAVQYSFYPNFRNLSTDVSVMIDRLGLNPEYYQNGNLHAADHQTSHFVRHYFSQLSHLQKLKLFTKLYEELDFYYHLYPREYNSHVDMLKVSEIIPYS